MRELYRLLSPRKRWQALALTALLLGNALVEMVGVGLVPVYIGILAEPERVRQNDTLAATLELIGVDSARLSPDTLLYGGSALLFAVFLIKLAYVPLMAWARARYIQAVVRGQSTRLLGAYLRAPYEFHLRRNSAELIRNVNAECTQLGERVLNPLANMLTQLFVTFAIVALLIVTIPGVAIYTLIAAALIAIPVVTILTRRIKRLAGDAQHGRKQVIRSVQEGLGGVKEIRLLGREGYFVTRFEKALRKNLDLQRFMQVQSVSLPVFMEWVAVTALLAMVLILYRTSGGQQDVLAIVALFAIATARLKGSVTGVLGSYAQVRASLVSVDVVARDVKLLEKMAHEPVDASHRGSTIPLRFSRRIELENVWFRYAGSEEYVLRGIDLTIEKGEAVGFVGPSGSGKSTLIDVILGILEPERGTIRVDGRDLREVKTDWHHIVGYIPQSIYLIDGTIRQNIALGVEDPDIDDTKINRAIRAAHIDDFVATLKQGADTRIGERGVRMSGGQRQRIAIARALYHDSQVLIMDEATAALDNITERSVIEAVEYLKGERTIMMIAHRLTTVRNCDRIVYLAEGKVDGIGRFDELSKTHASFKALAAGTSQPVG